MSPIAVPPSRRDQVVFIPSKGLLEAGRSPFTSSMYSVRFPKLGELPNPCDLWELRLAAAI